MPELRTERLVIRPFVHEDLDAVFRLYDVELADASMGNEGSQPREVRKEWLEWTLQGYGQLSHLYQPPYGDRAIVLASTGVLIGACGLVPCLDEYDRIPGLGATEAPPTGRASAEVGLSYAVSPAHQGRGYATEAARALVDYAFTSLRLARIIATTSRDNTASITVMRRLGMRVEENPFPEPPWLQVVGWLQAPPS
jgi:RimJ/RimL family protein N-acetyltransferase